MDIWEDDNSDEMDIDNDLMDDCEEDSFSESEQESNVKRLQKLNIGDDFHVEYAPQRNTTAYGSSRCPEHIKSKEKMGIGDLVKDHALPFLPAKSICRFRSVSKEWNKWITNPFLAHKQSHCFQDISGFFCQIAGEHSFISCDPHSCGVPDPSFSFLPEPVILRTTCNGLICCQSCIEDNAYYICNPVNRQWKVLPRPNYYHRPGSAVALAFEPSALKFEANYQLVCAFRLADHPILHFEIYSSRSKSWRLVDTICFELDALKLSGDGFYMKGMVYWETLAGSVLAFDLTYEQCWILPLPPECGPEGVLTKRHGELCYILPHKKDNEYAIRIYGDFKMVLKHSFPLELDDFGYTSGGLRALSCLNDDVLAILFGNRIITYHVKAQKVKILGTVRPDGFVTCHPYVNSLVPVDHPLVSRQQANSHPCTSSSLWHSIG